MAIRRFAPILVVLLFGLPLAACGQETTQAGGEAAIEVEEIAGSDLSTLTLSEHAAQRLAVATAAVEEKTVDGARHLVVPHSAVIWDSSGQAWAYTVVDTRAYVRAPLTVMRVDGDTAVLDDGPEAGTEVVTVGAPELWGAETGVGGGH
jgi:hypothetical protein